MKYPKTDFSGDPTKRARLLGFSEDCNIRRHRKQTNIRTTTTHSAMIKLFNDNLGIYGHPNSTPNYNGATSQYTWYLSVLLNDSFSFLLEYKRNRMKFLRKISKDGHEYTHLGSQTDAEGHVGLEDANGYTLPVLIITNNDRQLLEWDRLILGGKIVRNGSGYNLQLRGEKAVEAIRMLPTMHAEKVAAKNLILRHYDNGGIGTEALREYKDLRCRIRYEVRSCTFQARLEWIRRHGRPHPQDPDQTIPGELALSPFSFLFTYSFQQQHTRIRPFF